MLQSIRLGYLIVGQKVWEAHREHYYQRAIQMGLSHRGTALAEYALMAACSAAALSARTASPGIQASVLAAATLAYAVICLNIDARWSRRVQQ